MPSDKFSLEGGASIVTFEPGKILEFPAVAYLNKRPKLSHLRPAAAEQVKKERILTDYVFPEARTYFVKVVHSVLFKGTERVRPESKPTRVIVEEPTGEDFSVWEKIKDRPEIGFFIQHGWFRVNGDESKSLNMNWKQFLISFRPASSRDRSGKD